MMFRVNRFFLDEKDLFIGLFFVALLASFLLKMPLSPFRRESLTVLFLFLVITRSLITQSGTTAYLAIALFGLLFSLFLSPYGVMTYLVVAALSYRKFVR